MGMGSSGPLSSMLKCGANSGFVIFINLLYLSAKGIDEWRSKLVPSVGMSGKRTASTIHLARYKAFLWGFALRYRGDGVLNLLFLNDSRLYASINHQFVCG